MVTKKPTVSPALVSPKEMESNQAQLTKASNYATSLKVVDMDTYNAAMEEGKKIKEALETVTSRREEITKPMNDALKSVRTLFKPIETGLEDALKTIKSKMVAWHQEASRKEAEEKAKIAAKAEAGKIKEETAIRKIGEVEHVEKTNATEKASSTMRTVKKWRVVNKTQIPYEFLEPDMVKIKASFRAGTPVPGVEEYEEQELAIG